MKIVVGIADMRISSATCDEIVTYALGSCLGIAVYDPVAHVGGLLHVMLPDSDLDHARAEANPCVFVDTGVPHLFKTCYAAGAAKQRMVVSVAGGAATGVVTGDQFQIGQRNFTMLRRLLWKNGVAIAKQDVGGSQPRTMALYMETGQVTLRFAGAVTTM
jgi:chemotaxis protein CheD